MQQDFDINIVLKKPLIASLASSSKDGPRSSPLWFLFENDKIWLFGTDKDSFVKRLMIEPSCALSIVDFNLDKGIMQHVGIRGLAKINDVDQAKLNNFVGKYLGDNPQNWNHWFTNNIVNHINIMIEVTPESIVAKDVSFFKTGPDLIVN